MLNRRGLLTGLAATGVTGPAFAQAGAASSAAAVRFAPAISYAERSGGGVVLIQRHGVVLGDFHLGDAVRGQQEPLGEATRVFAPLLAAAMSIDNMLRLDEPVAQSIEGWAQDPRKQLITIRHLLDMTCGIALGVAPGAAANSTDALRAEAVADPGTRFIEDAAPYQIFAELAQRKLVVAGRGEDIASYLSRRVLQPIGASASLLRDGDGLACLTTGARASAESLAALGELIRRGGIHRGRALVSGSVLREARMGSTAQPRFGFGLWLSGPRTDARDPGFDLSTPDGAVPGDALGVGGADGNRLYIVPSAALVVTRLATTPAAASATWRDGPFLRSVLAAL